RLPGWNHHQRGGHPAELRAGRPARFRHAPLTRGPHQMRSSQPVPVNARRAAVALLAAAFVMAGSLAVATTASAAGPPFPSQAPGRSVYDPDGILAPATVQSAESATAALVGATGVQPLIYVERSPAALSAAQAGSKADALINQWKIGRGLLMLVDVNSNRCGGQIVLRRGTQVSESDVSDTALGSIADAVRG